MTGYLRVNKTAQKTLSAVSSAHVKRDRERAVHSQSCSFFPVVLVQQNSTGWISRRASRNLHGSERGEDRSCEAPKNSCDEQGQTCEDNLDMSVEK